MLFVFILPNSELTGGRKAVGFSGRLCKAGNNLQSPEAKIIAEAYKRALDAWEERWAESFLGNWGT